MFGPTSSEADSQFIQGAQSSSLVSTTTYDGDNQSTDLDSVPTRDGTAVSGTAGSAEESVKARNRPAKSPEKTGNSSLQVYKQY